MKKRPQATNFTKVSMLLTKEVNEYIDGLKANECKAVVDREAGTVIVSDGDVDVFKAIQKGHGQPWIAMFRESDRVKWSTP